MITNSTFSNDQETMELIDRYLLEQLDEIELKQFQDRMEQDFNLRSLVLDQNQAITNAQTIIYPQLHFNRYS